MLGGFARQCRFDTPHTVNVPWRVIRYALWHLHGGNAMAGMLPGQDPGITRPRLLIRRCVESGQAFITWWLAALGVSLMFPAMSDTLPISPLWVANALAYGSVLARGIRLVPAFTLAALLWNIARGDALAGILVGTGGFLVVMLFVAGFSRWLQQHIEQDHARRLLRVPIIATLSACLFTSLGVWQFARGIPSGELLIGLWLSEVTSVLLFTPLAQQWLEGRGHPLRGRHGLRPLGLALATWSLVAASILVALWLFGNSEEVPQRWLPYLALTIPIMAVYLLPGGLPRLVVPIFMLAWTAVDQRLYTGAGGILDAPAMLNGQMIIFTATLIGFLAIESVHSYDLANRQLDAARLHDGLTGLYNDLGLTKQLRYRQEGDAAPPLHALIGVQVPDIDDLATLMGLDEAHGIERRIAETIRHCVSSREGLAARLQPGLFALLVPIKPEGTAPLSLTHRLCDDLRAAENAGRLPVARLGLRVALVEGIMPVHRGHMTSLLLMACQRAGKQDNERFYHHRDAPNLLIDSHRDALDWAGRLRDALAGNATHGDFDLFAQPILQRDHPEIHRAEILIRWRLPDGSLRGPDTFLGIAENFGLMPRIDEWVLGRALSLVAGHPARQQLTEIAINLSGNSLESASFPDTLARLLDRNAWPPHQLCLEITETMLIQDTRLARHNVQAIHDLGVRLAIDDFGTGHATFAYLKEYPVEELKIDGSFIRNITTSEFDREVVRSTCALAGLLDARVVAEFVETQAQQEALADLGVDYLQGYGIAHPMPLLTYLDRLVTPTTVTQGHNNHPG